MPRTGLEKEGTYTDCQHFIATKSSATVIRLARVRNLAD